MRPGSDRVHLVLERTDGSRIVRLPAPRWLVSAAVAIAAVALVAAGTLYRDYVALRAQRAELASGLHRLAEQQTVIDGFQERLGQIRAEVDGWRTLRSKIWLPFGPASEVPAERRPGMGGTALRLLEHAAPPALSPLDEVERLAAAVGEEGEGLRALERLMAKAGRVLAALPTRWPVRGPVNSDFGKRSSPWAHAGGLEFHSGLDIGAAQGTRVSAPAPGTVVFAGTQPEYGITLIIDHGHDLKTLYGHLSKVMAAVGDTVRRGEVVAHTGNTGRSSGPHLHYEIQVAGQPVDPRSYLWD